MKIIISRAVLAASNSVGQHIACVAGDLADCAYPAPMHDVDAVIEGACASAVGFRNVVINFDHDTQELHYDVDDKVVLAVLKLYDKVAGYIGMYTGAIKALTSIVKTELKEIETLANERI